MCLSVADWKMQCGPVYHGYVCVCLCVRLNKIHGVGKWVSIMGWWKLLRTDLKCLNYAFASQRTIKEKGKHIMQPKKRPKWQRYYAEWINRYQKQITDSFKFSSFHCLEMLTMAMRCMCDSWFCVHFVPLCSGYLWPAFSCIFPFIHVKARLIAWHFVSCLAKTNR